MKIICLIPEFDSKYYRVFTSVNEINFESVALKQLPEISEAFNISVEELKLLIKK